MTHRSDRGFSFIELLAYMAIAALLILAAVPQFNNYRNQAHDANVKGDLKNIAVAMESAYVLNGVYPTHLNHVQNLGIEVTESAYMVANNAMLICSTGQEFAIWARSASGKRWQYTTRSGGVGQGPTAFPATSQVMCALAGFPADTTSLWMHDMHLADPSAHGYGWQF